ncbi:MAG: hypothetical protein CME06_01675, partial [Gemmatimonadetes bacterium]|nr:hypothetical protein [Gemmatimonadota bacterium]
MMRGAAAPILLTIAVSAVSAQELPSVLPIDADEVRAIAVNPALAAFSGEYLEIGAHESFLGITSSTLGLTAGFAPYAFSAPLRGPSLRTSHFSSHRLDRTRFGAGYGFAPLPWLALGASVDLIDLGYSNLDLVDLDDPLFADGRSRTGIGIGAGAALRGNSGFTAGASIEDLNLPDLSLDRNRSAPSAARLHTAVAFPLAGTRVALGARDIEIGSPGARGLSGAAFELGFGGWLNPWAGARAFGGNRGIGFEGKVVLPFGMEFRYRAEQPFSDLSSFSYGSHQIALVGLSDRPIRVPRMRPPPPPPP